MEYDDSRIILKQQTFYALLDKESLVKENINLLKFLEFLSTKNIKLLQYRNKSPKNFKEIEDDLKLIKKHFNGKVIVNDYLKFIDLADGIHLGQEDLLKINPSKKEAARIVRQKVGKNKFFGLSTHNLEEIKEANEFDLDYIGLGAYRATSTKKDANVLGEKIFKLAKYSFFPVAIIGGVKLDDQFPEEVFIKVIGSDLIRKFKESKDEKV